MSLCIWDKVYFLYLYIMLKKKVGLWITLCQCGLILAVNVGVFLGVNNRPNEYKKSKNFYFFFFFSSYFSLESNSSKISNNTTSKTSNNISSYYIIISVFSFYVFISLISASKILLTCDQIQMNN